MCLAFCTLYVERGATPALHLNVVAELPEIPGGSLFREVPGVAPGSGSLLREVVRKQQTGARSR